MPATCVVTGCTNRGSCGDPLRRYFNIPKVIRSQGSKTEQLSTDRRALWLERINREGFNPDPEKRYFKVCSDHFISGKRAALYDSSNPDWAPSLKMEPVPKPPKKTKSSQKRFESPKGRKEKRKRSEAALLSLQKQDTPVSDEVTTSETGEASDSETGETDDRETDDRETDDRETDDRETDDRETGDSETDDSETGDSETGDSETGDSETDDSETGDSETDDSETDDASERDVATASWEQSTDPQTDDTVHMKQMRKELQRLTKENMLLKKKLKETVWTPDSLKGNDAKVKYYTGVTYDTLMTVYTCVEASIPHSASSTLTTFEKLMMVLMKLRLNLCQQDLGYMFKVSTRCVSKVFLDVVHVLFLRMRGFILWPDRVDLRRSMPMEFRKNFGVKVSIIIDWFEIFIEGPSNSSARAETWSNHNCHNVVKYLTGMTPQGAVCFLSKGWGGQASDTYVIENCGLLSLLRPGDIVLADRGFDIPESVGLHCAEVKRPSFTRGKPQLSPLETESSRKMANSRIHVERVIGLVRNKYTILRHPIPMDYLHCPDDCVPALDKIVTVCCALSNLCGSVVPFD